ncbi:hypothetical protein AN958_04402 [Leucoagaricus sp. SymC.cos]|nr:hypothetical protein AN958_04402 [Leucoagaricus sp. SymC.cos]
MSETLSVSDSDDGDFQNQTFIPSEWIGVGKIYTKELPGHIQRAKNTAIAVPPTFLSLLPDNELPVLQFLAAPLPEEDFSIKIVAIEEWFSNRPPSTNPNVLCACKIPRREILDKLITFLPQAWLNGATSVADPNYNDGHSYLPLWTPIWWMSALDALATFGWNTRLRYQNGAIHGLICTALLGDEWLNDEVISIVIEETKKSLTSDHILLEDSRFHAYLNGFSAHGIEDGELGRIGRAVKKILKDETALGQWKFFFPIFVNNNHWIAGCMDFDRKEVGYGDSLKTAAPTSELHLVREWLESVTGETYICGIMALNAIRHQVLDIPLWSEYSRGDINLDCISWFNIIAENTYLACQKDVIMGTGNDCDQLASAIKTDVEDTPLYFVGDRVDIGDEISMVLAVESGSLEVSGSEIGLEAGAGCAEAHDIQDWKPLAPIFLHGEAKKQLRSDTADSTSRDLYNDPPSTPVTKAAGKPTSGFVPPGEGKSKSAIYSCKKRKAHRDGALQVSENALQDWWTKLHADNAFVETSSLLAMGFVKKSKLSTSAATATPQSTEAAVEVGHVPSKPNTQLPDPANLLKPCGGLSSMDDLCIGNYLTCVTALGGGGEDPREIAKRRFRKNLGELTDKERQNVEDVQCLMRRWINDHQQMCVYSPTCRKLISIRGQEHSCTECCSVLKIREFMNALQKKKPAAENMKFTNIKYHAPVLGDLFIQYLGLQDVIENSDNPLIQYACGALAGDYDDLVFIGLIQAMVHKHDREQ